VSNHKTCINLTNALPHGRKTEFFYSYSKKIANQNVVSNRYSIPIERFRVQSTKFILKSFM